MMLTSHDICVCCGRYTPEGRQVCTLCETREKQRLGYKPISYWRQIWLIIKFKLFGGAKR